MPEAFPREDPLRAALFTDIYELTMARAYAAEGMEAPAVFELFFRNMPEQRGFFVSAGLEDVLDYIEHFSFSDSDLDYLRGQGQFPEEFLEYLRGLRFRGKVWAMPEGAAVFADEPLIQVEAPILEAQILETFLLNQVHCQTVMATKAARVAEAAGEDCTVVDFGSRRAHGADAALKAARCSYLAGLGGSSNVLAGKLYGIPIFGTMAHSYIQAHAREEDAFRAFAGCFPETTLLVDTYDTLEGVRRVVALARELGEDFKVRAVRLDSGDLVELARESRRILDGAGLDQVKIFASSGLDEHRVAALLGAGAPIDGFGVGTKLVVSDDVPSLDMAYKLVAYDGQPRMNLSESKEIFPGRKQIFRREEGGVLVGDILAMHDEEIEGEPLLRLVMRDGRRCGEPVPLVDSRAFCMEQRRRLPKRLRQLEKPAQDYPVEPSERLRRETEALRERLESERDCGK